MMYPIMELVVYSALLCSAGDFIDESGVFPCLYNNNKLHSCTDIAGSLKQF